MQHDYLHCHKDFVDLLRIVGQERSVDPTLVEKDYWIMHCLYGLQQLDLRFELKGGTSLSKGFSIIQRFSEDIDIRIEPPKTLNVRTGRNHDKRADIESRKDYYDWLAKNIAIDGIETVTRDYQFDDKEGKYRSGGIRLLYKSLMPSMMGIKDGILLETGFDDVSPNIPIAISSWVYDYAKEKIKLTDNRAVNVPCYHPGYTLVEKLQIVSTKFRKQQKEGGFPANFMRHYYDIYYLLQRPEIQQFIQTQEYKEHKTRCFRANDNQIIASNEAFLLSDNATRRSYADAYYSKSTLYYSNQPKFEEIMELIKRNVTQL